MDANAPDIKDLEDQLDAAKRDAQALAAGSPRNEALARRDRFVERGGMP